MLNLSTSQKPVFEMAHVLTNAAKDLAQANVQFISTISKVYLDTWTTCCKLSEETTQQAAKTASTGK